jgi:PST family polysaccharide transporter
MPGIVYARMVTGVLAIGINMYVVQRLIGLSLLQQVGNTARSLLSVAAMGIALIGLCHNWSVGDTAGQRLVYLLLLGATGGVVYTAVHLFSWRLSGRPVGPESDLLGFVYKARDRVRAYFGRA